MGYSYCEKNYSKGGVNVLEITQRRLQNMKNVAMAGFYYLVSKSWKKIVFHVAIRREKTADLYCFLSANN